MPFLPRASVRRALSLIALLAVVLATSLVASPPASAATNLGITNIGSVVVDPVTSRVFVSGDDKVVVLNADGSPLTTLPGLLGAAGMSVDATSLWVTERTGAAISRFDLRSLVATGRFSTGVAMRGPVEVVGNTVWFLSSDQYSNSSLWRLDPTTGAVSPAGGQHFYGGMLDRIPGSTTRLLVSEPGVSPYSVYLVDLTTNPVTTLGDVEHGAGSNLGGVAATDRGTFVTASGAPYAFHQFSLTPTNGILPETGVIYPGTNYPNGIAYSPAVGGLVAGTTAATKKLFVARYGIALSTHTFALPGEPMASGVALADDGSRVYAVTQTGTSPWSLSVFGLTPELVSVSPQGVDQPATITLGGFGLPSATAVTVDGNNVAFYPVGSNLNVALPTLPNGTHLVAVVTPWGTTTSLPFEITSQPPPPVITSVSPRTGSTAGGTTITVTGSSFADVQSVHLGDIPMAFTLVGTSSITFSTPSHLPASAVIVVTTDHGTSNDDQTFAWAAPLPAVTFINPNTGPVAGGTTITIHGYGFSFATDVGFGGTPATSFEVFDDHTIQAVSPARTEGSAAVVVTTAGGTSPAHADSAFAFSAALPVVAELDLASGPATGGAVRLTGLGFIDASSVTLDGVASTFTVESDAAIAASVPAHAPGAVDVVVTTPNGPSSAITYTYIDPVTSGRPRVYAADAGTTVTGAVPLTGDFTGDGVEDTFFYGPGAIADSLWQFSPDGTHSVKPASVHGTFRPIAGDFTGDGIDDIFWYAPGTAADYLWNFTANGQHSLTPFTVDGTFRPLTGDFTGDDVDDIFWYAPGDPADALWDFELGGTHSVKPASVNGVFRPVAGDFTGDGIDDIFWHAPGSDQDYLWNFTATGHTLRRLNVGGTFRPFAGDFTGDGVDDVFWYAPGVTADSIWDFNLGGTFSSSSANRNDQAVPAAGDFTGGRVDDILWSTGAASAVWFLSPIVR